MAATIRIVIADDHKIFRQGLKAALLADDTIEVVGEAETGDEAVQLCEILHPEVAVLDISMPETNGLVAADMILCLCANTRVLLLSSHSDEQYLTRALRHGVHGYMLKSSSLEDLIAAIKTVHQGQTYLGPEIASFVVREFAEKGDGKDSLDRLLSSREQQVLQMIAEGLSGNEIAARLSLSPKTVRRHRENIMNKLDIHDTAGLVKFAIRSGLVVP